MNRACKCLEGRGQTTVVGGFLRGTLLESHRGSPEESGLGGVGTF
jgi:hypothetical protein